MRKAQVVCLKAALVLWVFIGVYHQTYALDSSNYSEWKLPEAPPFPADNATTPERVLLGKTLFFDPRLSGKGNTSCASCHSPQLGWSDGLPTAVGFDGEILSRASPTLFNTSFNLVQMWDGRSKSLEDQALGPLRATHEMNFSEEKLFSFINNLSEYKALFERAYPGDGVNAVTFSKALAAFERTILSNNSPFDHWLAGDAKAMTAAQERGFKIFIDPKKGNCSVCHAAPNFTDSGFNNIGIVDLTANEADLGRFNIRKIALMKGAFKTPTLRDISRTAPYFHNGSAKTLLDVVKHYSNPKLNWGALSPNMKKISLSAKEESDVVAFLEALTSPLVMPTLPELPLR